MELPSILPQTAPRLSVPVVTIDEDHSSDPGEEDSDLLMTSDVAVEGLLHEAARQLTF